MTHIHQLYNEWLSLQPLKPEDKNRLDRKFMLEFIIRKSKCSRVSK